MTASRSALVDAARYLDTWFAYRRRVDRVPGVQAAILHDDEVVLDAAYGLADVESGTALTPAHLFRIASHSKTFTATAVLQLAEREVLRLDDTAGRWLPHLNESPVVAVTIRELLAHGSGITRDSRDGDFWQLGRPFPDAAELERIAGGADAAVLERNVRFKYSNIGYSLLGRIIEVASGVTYAEYVSREIVEVLGLTATGPELDPDRLAEYASGYTSLSYADIRLPIEHVDTGAMAPATGFYSTASELVRYFAAHFHGDTRLLTDDSKRLMQRTEWKVVGGDTEYGLGMAISTIGGRRLLGHGGGYPGHITRTLFDPVDRIAVSVMTNTIDGPAQTLSNATIRVIDLAQRSLDETAGAPAGPDLSRFRGRFAGMWGVFDIVDLGGRLFQLDPEAADPTDALGVLDVVDEDTLRMTDAPGYASPGELITFEREADGRVRSVRAGSGATAYPMEAITTAAATRTRITLGSPLAPGVTD